MQVLVPFRLVAISVGIASAITACAATPHSVHASSLSSSHAASVHALGTAADPVLASMAPAPVHAAKTNASKPGNKESKSAKKDSPTLAKTPTPASQKTVAPEKVAATGLPPSPSAGCGAVAADTPGGADPWDGCWPGPANTGVPAGTPLVTIDSAGFNSSSSALPAGNTGWTFSSGGYIEVTSSKAVIDGVADGGSIYVPSGDSLTVKDSKAGFINDQGSSLLVENSTLNGGDQWEFSTVTGGSNITVENSNLSGGGHEVLCYNNCVVENSWLHDNANGASSGAHQNGFLADGGSGYTLRHNSIHCTGGCTADISFLSTDSNATVTDNLLVASPDAAYCVYPGPDSSTESGINNMVWEDNVFQPGSNGKCATYGPVYGWYPSDGTGNVWSGNMWANGAIIPGS